MCKKTLKIHKLKNTEKQKQKKKIHFYNPNTNPTNRIKTISTPI